MTGAGLAVLAGLAFWVWLGSWTAPWPIDHICAFFSAPVSALAVLAFVVALNRETV